MARLAVALTVGAGLMACAKTWPGPALQTESGVALGSATTASSTLLAAAEGQSDAMPLPASGYGDYLAGLVATNGRDLDAAADFMIRALESDPDNLDLLRRAYILTAAEGRHNESLRLARDLIQREPSNGAALLTAAVDDVMHDRREAALALLEAQPQRGLPMIYGPLLRAWLEVGQGDLAAAQREAEVLGQREGFESLYQMHKALIYDVGGDTAAAAEAYGEFLDQVEAPSLRLALLAGNFYERSGDVAAAEAVYAKYYAANPESVLLVPLLSKGVGAAAPEPILQDYRDGWAEVLFDLAGVLSQERADEIALIHVHLALRLKPDLELGHLLVGEVMEGRDRGQDAIDAYRRIDPASPLAWTARLRVAEVLGEMERTDEAVAELEALAAERPESFEPLYRIGNLLRSQERFADAADAYDRAGARIEQPERHHWSLYYFRGISLERAGEWKRAEEDFLKALELEPEQPYVMNYLAYSWIEKKAHLDEAKQMLVRAVELRPTDGYIVDSLGWVYYRLGHYDDAVEHLERAVELRPQDPVINDHLGDAYWRVGRRQEARFQWRRALSFAPEADQVPTIEAKIERGLVGQPENI